MRIKTFSSNNSEMLDCKVNCWIAENEYKFEIIDIKYGYFVKSSTSEYFSAMVLWKYKELEATI